MADMQWYDWVVFALGVWGAALSTILGVLKMREGRPRLCVTCTAVSDGPWAPNGVGRFNIDAVNIGGKPVLIAEAGIRFRGGAKVTGEYDDRSGAFLPRTAGIGEPPVTISIDLTPYMNRTPASTATGKRLSVLRPKLAYVRDGSGRIHRGKLPPVLARAVLLAAPAPAAPPATANLP
jgi:hypothetical protein